MIAVYEDQTSPVEPGFIKLVDCEEVSSQMSA